MFSTPEVKTYLLDTYPDVDGEKRVIKIRCYVNPISYELAQEVDPEIASTLFHRIGGEMAPRPILNHCRFASNIGPHSMAYCRDPEHGNSRVFVPAVKISKLEAGKVTPESNDFALMFTVEFDKSDPKVLNDLSDLMHEHFYCTFSELQPALFEDKPWMELTCRLCEAGSPEFVTTDKKFAYCGKCAPNKQDGEVLERIRDSAKAAVVAESMGREPGDEEPEPRKDPLQEDINQRNQMSRRGKKK